MSQQAGRQRRWPERAAEAWSEQGLEQGPTRSLLCQGRKNELWKTLWVPQICFLFSQGGEAGPGPAGNTSLQRGPAGPEVKSEQLAAPQTGEAAHTLGGPKP